MVLLVHTTGVLYGSAMPPASMGAPPSALAHEAGGVPAETQRWNAAICAAVGGETGGGGMGIAAPGCMRASATWATDFVLSVVAGAVSDA
jgi:hypothetical protein